MESGLFFGQSNAGYGIRVQSHVPYPANKRCLSHQHGGSFFHGLLPKRNIITAASTPAQQPPSKNPSKPKSSSQESHMMNESKKQSWQWRVFDALEDIMNTRIDPSGLRDFWDPEYTLFHGNFAPVDELPPTECEVIEGALPPCLEGAYIRNGPNLRSHPVGPYHIMDGDGMLHCIRIRGGKATLCSRYVRTNKYVAEEQAGTNLTPRLVVSITGPMVGSMARFLLSVAKMLAWRFDLRAGVGTANTNIATFGDNKLYALHEFDLPYQIKVTTEGNIETMGRRDVDFGNGFNMTAHPKLDPDTGEVFAFRYFMTPPFLTYFWFDAQGNKQSDVPIFSVKKPSIMHDFAVTKKYAIFPNIQISLLLTGRSAMGFDSEKVPQLGVIPRYAEDGNATRWFDVPGLNILHTVNGWDEEGNNGEEYVVVIALNILSIEHGIERIDLLHESLEMVKINLGNGTVTRQPLSAKNLEYGVVNPAYTSKKSRYVYAGVLSDKGPPGVRGIVKLDVAMAERDDTVANCTTASRMYGPGCYGGPISFVACEPKDLNAAEDDGYLVSYIHDEIKGESRFIVMDSKSTSLDIVASVKLPQRVPYGFHGLFIRDDDLDLQKM